MGWAKSKSLVAGVLLGALAAALTVSIDRLTFVAPNLLVRWLQAAAFTLVVPEIMLNMALGRGFHEMPLWLASLSNFAFWFGFAWLFGFLLGKLTQQIRLLNSNF